MFWRLVFKDLAQRQSRRRRAGKGRGGSVFAAYDFRERLDWKRLAAPLCSAAAALARPDERLRLLSFAGGVSERLVYHEACAVRLLEGELVHVEDLVLL
jgi:hypothetical protein